MSILKWDDLPDAPINLLGVLVPFCYYYYFIMLLSCRNILSISVGFMVALSLPLSSYWMFFRISSVIAIMIFSLSLSLGVLSRFWMSALPLVGLFALLALFWIVALCFESVVILVLSSLLFGLTPFFARADYAFCLSGLVEIWRLPDPCFFGSKLSRLFLPYKVSSTICCIFRRRVISTSISASEARMYSYLSLSSSTLRAAFKLCCAKIFSDCLRL